MSDARQPFCESVWRVGPFRHACIYRKGHAGSCWCCATEDGYPGGDLTQLEAPEDPQGTQ